MEKEIERLIRKHGRQKFLEAVGAALAKEVRKEMTCFLTGKPLAHEAICHYCNRCPAGRWFKVEVST